MKPGDLLILVGEAAEPDVQVARDDSRQSLFVPKGTPALFIGERARSDGSQSLAWEEIDILVGDVLGWVFRFETQEVQ